MNNVACAYCYVIRTNKYTFCIIILVVCYPRNMPRKQNYYYDVKPSTMQQYHLTNVWRFALAMMSVITYFFNCTLGSQILYFMHTLMAFITFAVIIKEIYLHVTFEILVRKFCVWMTSQMFSSAIWLYLYGNNDQFQEYCFIVNGIIWIGLGFLTLLYHAF